MKELMQPRLFRTSSEPSTGTRTNGDKEQAVLPERGTHHWSCCSPYYKRNTNPFISFPWGKYTLVTQVLRAANVKYPSAGHPRCSRHEAGGGEDETKTISGRMGFPTHTHSYSPSRDVRAHRTVVPQLGSAPLRKAKSHDCPSSKPPTHSMPSLEMPGNLLTWREVSAVTQTEGSHYECPWEG